jgi:hypothetical protein
MISRSKCNVIKMGNTAEQFHPCIFALTIDPAFVHFWQGCWKMYSIINQ